MAKTIKVSDETYRLLIEKAGEMQKGEKRKVTIDEAIKGNIVKRGSYQALKNFEGRWKMSDKEADQFMKELRKRWKNWKAPSV